ncbi:MAG: hypothetical protein ACKOOG_09270, partial [Actinomycetota bacterium]
PHTRRALTGQGVASPSRPADCRRRLAVTVTPLAIAATTTTATTINTGLAPTPPAELSAGVVVGEDPGVVVGATDGGGVAAIAGGVTVTARRRRQSAGRDGDATP